MATKSACKKTGRPPAEMNSEVLKIVANALESQTKKSVYVCPLLSADDSHVCVKRRCQNSKSIVLKPWELSSEVNFKVIHSETQLPYIPAGRDGKKFLKEDATRQFKENKRLTAEEIADAQRKIYFLPKSHLGQLVAYADIVIKEAAQKKVRNLTTPLPPAEMNSEVLEIVKNALESNALESSKHKPKVRVCAVLFVKEFHECDYSCRKKKVINLKEWRLGNTKRFPFGVIHDKTNLPYIPAGYRGKYYLVNNATRQLQKNKCLTAEEIADAQRKIYFLPKSHFGQLMAYADIVIKEAAQKKARNLTTPLPPAPITTGTPGIEADLIGEQPPLGQDGQPPRTAVRQPANRHSRTEDAAVGGGSQFTASSATSNGPPNSRVASGGAATTTSSATTTSDSATNVGNPRHRGQMAALDIRKKLAANLASARVLDASEDQQPANLPRVASPRDDDLERTTTNGARGPVVRPLIAVATPGSNSRNDEDNGSDMTSYAQPTAPARMPLASARGSRHSDTAPHATLREFIEVYKQRLQAQETALRHPPSRPPESYSFLRYLDESYSFLRYLDCCLNMPFVDENLLVGDSGGDEDEEALFGIINQNGNRRTREDIISLWNLLPESLDHPVAGVAAATGATSSNSKTNNVNSASRRVEEADGGQSKALPPIGSIPKGGRRADVEPCSRNEPRGGTSEGANWSPTTPTQDDEAFAQPPRKGKSLDPSGKKNLEQDVAGKLGAESLFVSHKKVRFDIDNNGAAGVNTTGSNRTKNDQERDEAFTQPPRKRESLDAAAEQGTNDRPPKSQRVGTAATPVLPSTTCVKAKESEQHPEHQQRTPSALSPSTATTTDLPAPEAPEWEIIRQTLRKQSKLGLGHNIYMKIDSIKHPIKQLLKRHYIETGKSFDGDLLHPIGL